MTANKGDWVQIHNIVLKPEERAPQVPADTKDVPLELWVKGYITHSANVGDTAQVKTTTGRMVTGELIEINPPYVHTFGDCVPELLEVRDQVKSILFGGE